MSAEAPPMTPTETFDRLVKEIGTRLDYVRNVLPGVDRKHAAAQLDRVLVWTGLAVEALTHRPGPPAMWTTCQVCGAYSIDSFCERCETWAVTGEWPAA